MGHIFGSTFRWLGKTLLLYCLFVAALIFAIIAAPKLYDTHYSSPKAAAERAPVLNSLKKFAQEKTKEANSELDSTTAGMRQSGIKTLKTQLKVVQQDKKDREKTKNPACLPLSLNPAKIQSDCQAKIERDIAIKFLDRKEASLHKAIELAAAKYDATKYKSLKQERLTVERLRTEHNTARNKLQEIQKTIFGKSAFDFEEESRAKHSHNDKHGKWKEADDNFNTKNAAAKAAFAAQRLANASFEATRGKFEFNQQIIVNIEAQVRSDIALRAGSLVEIIKTWAGRNKIGDLLWYAAWLLILSILTPFIIRILFYYVFAPRVARQPPIRLHIPAAAQTAPTAPISTTSVSVKLESDEELFVRQGYLQSESELGEKKAKWLLSWWHPLTSLAAALYFVTNIRGAGESTTISAVNDPFAEVTILTLPAGAACVLHPRALVAVVQQIPRPLRITPHWRLDSLHAWLTFQFRYLIFHGPARLVIKGGRGVRVEPAHKGRVFGQDQLVGFSANLAYSVTRTSTFLPYLFGCEQLFKDRVIDGDGVVIIEESPMAGRRNGEARGGLEGAFDAGLKATGIG